MKKKRQTYSLSKKIGFCWVMLILIFTSLNLNAQNIVTGKVTGANGEKLPGAAVIVEGSTSGTVTDLNGNYSITVPDEASNLIVSYVGYVTLKLPVSGQSIINVTLEEDITSLSEVVVLGYSTMARRDVTGSIASLTSDEIVRTPVADASQAIQGKLPGVTVTSQDGRPGADIAIRVRGGGSITQSNQPLFIVDGFPASTINDIPGEQIKSIDVLKDASSTAIYGARGANGVIIITTKSGKIGKPKVSYNGYSQWNTVPKYLEVMEGYDYIAYNWAYASAIGDQYAEAWERLWAIGRFEGSNSQGIDYYKNVPSRDFTRELYNNSFTHNHNLNISGGTKNTQYLVALNHIDQDGMKVASYYKRTNVQFKFDQKLGEKLSIHLNSRFSQVGEGGNEGVSTAYWFRPIDTKYVLGDMDVTTNTQLGDYNSVIQDMYNPVSIWNDRSDDMLTRSIVNNAGLNWDIANGLSFSSNISLGLKWINEKIWDGAVSRNYLDNEGNKKYSGDAEIEKEQKWDWRWNNVIRYEVPGLSNDHKLNVLGGMELSDLGSERTRIWGRRYPSTYDKTRVFANMGDYFKEEGGSTTYGDLESSVGASYSMISYFGQANYSLMDKYLLTATFRADGSSKFAPENRWGYFPAAAVAWRLSNEPFAQELSWLDDLKLRASYGSVGSDKIGTNLWKQDWTSGTTQFSIEEQIQPQYEPASSTLANPNLIWETTITRNLGLDFTIFSGNLSGTIELYKNSVKDLLVITPISSLSGFSFTYDNIGATSNKGVEISFEGNIIRTGDFNLKAGFNINFNKGNVDELAEGVTGYYFSGWGGVRHAPSTGDYFLTVGEPVGLIRGWIHDGMYTTDDFDYDPETKIYTLKEGVPDLSSGLLPNIYGTFENKPGSQTAYPGVQKVKDINNDGIVDEEDLTVIGNTNPVHTGGFNIGGVYKNIDFGLDFIWSYGNDIYNATHLQAYLGLKESGLYRNRYQELKGHYKIYDIVNGQLEHVVEPNALDALNADATTFLPYPESSINTTFGVEDGSFLRLQTVTLGYTLPQSWASNVKINKLRIYGSIFNVLTFTGYKGLDPEVNVDENRNENFPTPGLDFGFYPRARRFTLGVNIEF